MSEPERPDETGTVEPDRCVHPSMGVEEEFLLVDPSTGHPLTCNLAVVEAAEKLGSGFNWSSPSARSRPHRWCAGTLTNYVRSWPRCGRRPPMLPRSAALGCWRWACRCSVRPCCRSQTFVGTSKQQLRIRSVLDVPADTSQPPLRPLRQLLSRPRNEIWVASSLTRTTIMPIGVAKLFSAAAGVLVMALIGRPATPPSRPRAVRTKKTRPRRQPAPRQGRQATRRTDHRHR